MVLRAQSQSHESGAEESRRFVGPAKISIQTDGPAPPAAACPCSIEWWSCRQRRSKILTVCDFRVFDGLCVIVR